MAFQFKLPWPDVGNGISNSDGARLYFYEQGTSTDKTVYSDFNLTTPYTQPVISDQDGLFSAIYLDDVADVSLHDGDDVLIVGPETVYPPDDSIASLAASAVSVADSGGNYTATDAEGVFAEIASDYMRQNRAETITGTKTFSSANIDMGDNEILQAQLRDFSFTTSAVVSSSGTLTLDLSVANSFTTTLFENITTMTVTNIPSTGDIQFQLVITQDGAGGAYTVALPSGSVVPGGGGYTMSTGNNAIDKLIFFSDDQTTSFLVDFSQAYA